MFGSVGLSSAASCSSTSASSRRAALLAAPPHVVFLCRASFGSFEARTGRPSCPDPVEGRGCSDDRPVVVLSEFGVFSQLKGVGGRTPREDGRQQQEGREAAYLRVLSLSITSTPRGTRNVNSLSDIP